MGRVVMGSVLILLTIIASLQAVAQTSSACKVGVKAPAYGYWTWPAKTQIKVYILSTDFKPEEIPHLMAPFQNWEHALKATGSGVRFKYEGNVSTSQHCENCLTIRRGEVFGKDNHLAAELRGYSAHSNQILTHATIVIDHRATDPKMISSTVAHEIGHSLGLLDCFTCGSGSTVMTGFKGINVSNGIEGPTGCDIAQVAKAYGELKMRRRSPVADKNSVDEGEEPVEDDTPIMVPRP